MPIAARSQRPPAMLPFNKPYLVGKELEYVSQVITSGRIAADGDFTKRCAALLEDRFAIRKVFMTPSCTAALEMAAILCDLGPGDEVIMPSFTFASTASAVMRSGAKPVFVEIRPDTFNIDEMRIEAAISPRTRAIFPVHYAGVGCEMNRIMAIADAHGLKVVEDAAQGVNSSYDGRALGSIGHMGVYSFHDTKNVICGEGGAICINTPELVERAEIVRDKGTNRSQFFRGEVDKYTWVEVGSSFLPSELACAFLCAQLEAMDAIKERREAIAQYYRERLEPLEWAGFLRLPVVPRACVSHCRTFYIVLPGEGVRDALMNHLRKHGVSAVFHFVPLHSSPMGRKLGYKKDDLPLTEEMSARLLRLPSFVEITEAEQARVVELVSSFLLGGRAVAQPVAIDLAPAPSASTEGAFR
ncbi:MAG TPA: dTDP-4-amino-4,6-dideoxygalactose transaminase [Isosphaeraceae bacterium]|nr:dTDP-4-amino-4,6-dideoxygalactose transaminase [Isosphaeraceae bacterium]